MAGTRREGADAYQRALGLLVRREHSRRDLARKLAQRGGEPAEAAAAVEKLAGQLQKLSVLLDQIFPPQSSLPQQSISEPSCTAA